MSLHHEFRGTLIGAIAIILWALLAWLTSLTGTILPFALVGMTFGIAFLLWLGRFMWLCRVQGKAAFALFHQSIWIWCLGIGGLFLYHAFYFIALDHAPAIDASLIAYLWPLLIVIFSGFLPGEKVRMWHIFGALMGFTGAVLLIAGKGDVALSPDYIWGYFFALLCAFTWSSYSILSRRVGKVTSDIIGPCCGATALLGWVGHFILEPSLNEMNITEAIAVIALGIGPVGLAFFVWDYGVKHGNIVMLGTLSYFSPVLSTLILIAAGQAHWTINLISCATLITLGALFASHGERLFRSTSLMKRLKR